MFGLKASRYTSYAWVGRGDLFAKWGAQGYLYPADAPNFACPLPQLGQGPPPLYFSSLAVITVIANICQLFKAGTVICSPLGKSLTLCSASTDWISTKSDTSQKSQLYHLLIYISQLQNGDNPFTSRLLWRGWNKIQQISSQIFCSVQPRDRG